MPAPRGIVEEQAPVRQQAGIRTKGLQSCRIVDPVAVVAAATSPDPGRAGPAVPGPDHGPDSLQKPTASSRRSVDSRRRRVVQVGTICEDEVGERFHSLKYRSARATAGRVILS